MVTLARRAQRIPFAPVVAVLFGAVAAILVAAVPQWLFEKAVVASGLPTVLAAAAPPLGMVARILAIALSFAAVAFVLWIMLTTVTRLLDARKRAQTLWRDGGYDGDALSPGSELLPPRRPIFAPDELGAPLMSDEAIAPAAPLDVPLPQFMHDPKLAEPVMAEDLAPPPLVTPATDSTIAGLIRRLEDGLARRAANDPDPDGPGSALTSPPSASWILPDSDAISPAADEDDDVVRQALGTLRRMARG